MSLTLVPQIEEIQCAGCTARIQDVAVGVPEGWDAVFTQGEWTLLCGHCRAPIEAPVFAVLRPRAGEIALFVGTGGEVRDCALGLAEARQLHRTLGQALALAVNPGGLAPSTSSGQAA